MTVEFRQAVVGYGSKTILSGISLSFVQSDSVCLLGANGIGKTTVFKTLLGLIPLLQGDICIDGTSIMAMTRKDIAMCFAYVPQAKDCTYQFTVEEIVLMGRAMYIKRFSSPSRHDHTVAMNFLEKLGIEHMKDAVYSELSGGEQQIVLLARALAQEAKFIIMDEPASNLDFANQKKLLEVIRNHEQLHVGIFMSTHSPDHALYSCNKAVLVMHGNRYLYGDTEDIITSRNLTQAYGVEIKVIEGSQEGRRTKTCGLIMDA